MASSVLIAARVSPQTKAHVAALAQRQQLTESAFLKRLVESMLQVAGAPMSDVLGPAEPRDRGARVYVRLRDDDRLLLRERATARGMPAATYASLLLRAHLRRLTPIPTQELVTLKRSVAELGAIGRNVNQIARVANETGHVAGLSVKDLQAMLRALEGLRDHFKTLIKANLMSWESGSADGEQ
jgi:hypothetical protein